MTASTDALIAALTHPSLYLMGNEDGGVELLCRDHFDGGRPLACYNSPGDRQADPKVVQVATIPGLWIEAVKHLASGHQVTPENGDAP